MYVSKDIMLYTSDLPRAAYQFYLNKPGKRMEEETKKKEKKSALVSSPNIDWEPLFSYTLGEPSQILGG